MVEVLEMLRRNSTPIVIPTVVVAEWWRGAGQDQTILLVGGIEELDIRIATIAGVAIASAHFKMDAAVTIDAIVMATAAQHEEPAVYSADFSDLERFKPAFPSVRILGWK